MRTIGIVSGKGGVGKTTISVNLGAQLVKEHGKSVMIVDCNITTPHVPLHLGMMDLKSTINHVLKGSSQISDAIYNHRSGLKVMPASIAISDLEGVDMFKVPGVIKRINKDYFNKLDFLLLDTAPGFGREAMAAMQACNELLMVATPHTPSVMDLVRCRHAADEFDLKTIGTALNMVRGDRGELKKRDVEMVSGTRVLSSIPFDKNMARSITTGMPIVIDKKRSKASKKVSELAKLVL